ncbi:transporter substrate-binding domain-containing protein [Psychromonas sp. MME2]|uniref:substrate-binding periplasmic protein n=1 Tax=unclassified Psychromonas TaxID=2614957 RepID=UPI00339C87DB
MVRFIFILLFLSLPTCASEIVKKKVTLVYEVKANPPFYFGEGSNIDWKKPGITLELLKLLEKKFSIKIEFKRRPWARGLKEVQANVVDGIFHASFKPERLQIGVYPMKNGLPDGSRKIMSQSYFLYKYKNSPLQWDGKEITNLNGEIGAVRGYAIVGTIKALGVQVHEVRSQFNGLKMLKAGRIAAWADIETMADFQMKLHPEEFKYIIKVFPPFMQVDYYLMFSHQFVQDNPELSEAIWDTIRELRDSSQYELIVDKYFQPEVHYAGKSRPDQIVW